MPWLFTRIAPNWLFVEARTVAGFDVRAAADLDAFVAAGFVPGEVLHAAATRARAPTKRNGKNRAPDRTRDGRSVS